MTPALSAKTVTLVVKPECHLCLEAWRVASEICAEFGVELGEQSILDDAGQPRPEYARFAEEVPVLLIDGVQRDFWKIDPVRLRRLLTEG